MHDNDVCLFSYFSRGFLACTMVFYFVEEYALDFVDDLWCGWEVFDINNFFFAFLWAIVLKMICEGAGKGGPGYDNQLKSAHKSCARVFFVDLICFFEIEANFCWRFWAFFPYSF